MILLVSAVFPPEPVVSASLVMDLAISLSKIEDVKVLTPKPSRPMGFSFKEESSANHRFEHIILNSITYPKSKIVGRMIESYSFGLNAVKYIKQHRTKIKCIYLNSWPLFSQYLIVKASKKYSIPVVLHVQDIYPESLFNKIPVFKSIFIKMLLPIDIYVKRNVKKVVTISPSMKSFLIKSRRIPENKVDLVYNWQDEDNFNKYREFKNKEQKKDKFTFMFLGNLNRTSGVHFLISSFINSNLENSKLIIAGSGPERETLMSHAKMHKNIDVEFMDAPVMKVPDIQDKADIMLLSLKKGAARFALPSKLVAYLYSAKPIIACVDEDSDTANAISMANCGWIVSPEDENCLTKRIKTVASMPQVELLKYGKNGLKYALENYTKKNNLHKIQMIILSIAQE